MLVRALVLPAILPQILQAVELDQVALHQRAVKDRERRLNHPCPHEEAFCLDNFEEADGQYHVKCHTWQQRCPCMCSEYDEEEAFAQLERNKLVVEQLGVEVPHSHGTVFGREQGRVVDLEDEEVERSRHDPEIFGPPKPTVRPTAVSLEYLNQIELNAKIKQYQRLQELKVRQEAKLPPIIQPQNIKLQKPPRPPADHSNVNKDNALANSVGNRGSTVAAGGNNKERSRQGEMSNGGANGNSGSGASEAPWLDKIDDKAPVTFSSFTSGDFDPFDGAGQQQQQNSEPEFHPAFSIFGFNAIFPSKWYRDAHREEWEVVETAQVVALLFFSSRAFAFIASINIYEKMTAWQITILTMHCR